ncbi:hypothetical protein GH714_023456 [Hevea brasiliensis]|uniref:Large ribosomal subunit protein uL4 C-terminal domain-containing protein n=1 Tax=Hevea brasiliensis TaxID=3981 RepID=A0A6A6LUI2_HEVBR|nr:hypothetical protein GH714_023456 [Hevea brasiliensis]
MAAADTSAVRPLVTVQSLPSLNEMATDSSTTLAPPDVMKASIGPDIVNFVHANISKNSRQPFAVSKLAGHQTSAESWGTGRAVSRIPRVPGGGTYRAGQGAFGNMCRGGRMFAPTKIWRRWHRKINVNQKRYAVVSAIAASAISSLVMARGHKVESVPEMPMVISDSAESVEKTSAAIKVLKKIGAYSDAEKAKDSHAIRPGKGNIPGVELANVDRLNVLKLAPGGHLGRFIIWTKSAFENLDSIYGSFEKPSEKKNGYVLPRAKMVNADLARIINSDEMQSVVKPIKKETVRRMSLLAEVQRVKANKVKLDKKRKTVTKSTQGTLFINGTASIGATDHDFICATLDWWPPDKCDYGTCSWGRASLLNLCCCYFRLNALKGRTIASDGSAVGAWDPSDAKSLIRYTVNKGYRIHGWELGNELSGNGVGTRLSADQYASDINTLQNIVENIHAGFEDKPLVLAPGGFFDANWFTKFIDKTPKSLQVVTQHIYNLGPDPSYLDGGSQMFSSLQGILKSSGTQAVAWVGEAGGAYNSGHNLVTNAFVFSFWYLDQLGMASSYDTKTYCRQTLIGGNYGLLNTTTFVPNPDYYRLIPWISSLQQGITLLLINLDGNTTFQVSISTENFAKNGTWTLQEYQSRRAKFARIHRGSKLDEDTREEYHLTAKDNDLHSQTVLLNGKILTVSSSGAIPPLEPIKVSLFNPITVAPLSIVFAQITNMTVPACV